MFSAVRAVMSAVLHTGSVDAVNTAASSSPTAVALPSTIEHELAAQQAELYKRFAQQQAEQDARLQQELAAFDVGGFGSPSDPERVHSLLKYCSSIETRISPLMLQTAIDGGATKRVAAADGSDVLSLRERPIIAADDLQRLLNKLHDSYLEVELVALLTPTLVEVVRQLPEPEQLLVNIESLTRLGLLVCHRSAFVAGSSPEGTTDQQSRAAQLRGNSSAGVNAFLFGRCLWQLREAVECIIEVRHKNMPLDEALDLCFSKARNLLLHSFRPIRKVVLFDARCLRLLMFAENGLVSMQEFEWTAPGSFVVLLDFLHMHANAEPDWLCVLRSACINFKVTLAPTNAFLGQGTTGRVFRVDEESAGSAGTSRTYALKVVEGNKHGKHITTLRHEVKQLTRLLTISNDQPDVRQHLPQSCSKLYVAQHHETGEQLGAARHVRASG